MQQRIKKEIKFLSVFILLLFVLTACATQPNVDWKFKISGDISNPLVLTYANLASMPQKELKDILMQKTTSEDTVNTWVGVPLDDIAAKAGADPNYATILVRGDDGYEMVISKNEIKGAIEILDNPLKMLKRKMLSIILGLIELKIFIDYK